MNYRAVVARPSHGDVIASILGFFAALGTLAFLTALLAAGDASIDAQINALAADGTITEVTVAGTIAALVVVFASFFVGGLTAGRMAQSDGGLNGAGTALWMLLLVAVFAVLGAFFGAEFNAFAGVDLPNWISQLDADDVTVAAGVAAIAAIAVMFLGGWLGGRLGESTRPVEAAVVDVEQRVPRTTV